MWSSRRVYAVAFSIEKPMELHEFPAKFVLRYRLDEFSFQHNAIKTVFFKVIAKQPVPNVFQKWFQLCALDLFPGLTSQHDLEY